uniref:Uncharacterized protein n=1 Tax=Acrobeloides nanus TaxID=290746 RepID=A0A914CH43_9BILA
MGSSYKACDITDGEDSSCSDSISDLSFIFQNGGNWHVHYFGHNIGSYGPNSCVDSAATSSLNIALFGFSLLTLYFIRSKKL